MLAVICAFCILLQESWIFLPYASDNNLLNLEVSWEEGNYLKHQLTIGWRLSQETNSQSTVWKAHDADANMRTPMAWRDTRSRKVCLLQSLLFYAFLNYMCSDQFFTTSKWTKRGIQSWNSWNQKNIRRIFPKKTPLRIVIVVMMMMMMRTIMIEHDDDDDDDTVRLQPPWWTLYST